MQNIEINTTQNVRITYEVAHLGDRAFAFLIDLLIIGGGFLISSLFSVLISGDSTSWIFYTISIPFFVFYTLVSEIVMKGQTIGKKILNVQIVKLNGTEANASDYFLRWIFRVIDIYLCLGTIAAIFVVTSKKGQRLGDLVSETSAIRVKPSIEMLLREIELKYLNDPYEPKYPQVKKLSETDMLLIQSVIIRYKKYLNKAHREVLSELVRKVREKLNIAHEEEKEEEVQFLSTLIRDYIILTR